jgi:hypothetical protein
MPVSRNTIEMGRSLALKFGSGSHSKIEHHTAGLFVDWLFFYNMTQILRNIGVPIEPVPD